MASGDGFADQTINLLQDKISNQRGEIADFVHDLREVLMYSLYCIFNL